MDDSKHNRFVDISPTALGIAWRRTFMEIPYSVEMYAELQKTQKTDDPQLAITMQAPEITPYFEARYKILDMLLVRSGVNQVLELAAGLAPRGLTFTSDPKNAYVELDLPNLIKEKIRIIEAIEKPHQNLHFVEGSALSQDDVEKAGPFFSEDKEVAIINEGLLRYLSHDEKARVAQNVRMLLKRFGGVWITPDISLASIFTRVAAQSAEANKVSDEVEKMTNVNKDKNYFTDEAEARTFFEAQGFTIEQHRFNEVADVLRSPQKLNISKENTNALIEYSVAYVMKLHE